MNSSISRKNILKKISGALREKINIPFAHENEPIFLQDTVNLSIRFTNEYSLLEGKVFHCNGKKELFDKLKTLGEQKKWKNVSCQTTSLLKNFQLELLPFINKKTLYDAEAGITDCECLVARTGTVVLSAIQSSGRTLPVYVPIHLVIANENQLVFNINDALDRIKQKYPEGLPSALFFASGPSRTGDIERTLVVGVHGPKEAYVFLMKDEGKTN